MWNEQSDLSFVRSKESFCRFYKLRFELEDWDGNTAYAEYSSFRVTSEADKYRLLLGDYSGNASADAADDMSNGFLYHNRQQFSTFDRDNDGYQHGSCVNAGGGGASNGGFWYRNCATVTATSTYCPTANCGRTFRHLNWNAWQTGDRVHLKKMTMMMRPTDF